MSTKKRVHNVFNWNALCMKLRCTELKSVANMQVYIVGALSHQTAAPVNEFSLAKGAPDSHQTAPAAFVKDFLLAKR